MCPVQSLATSSCASADEAGSCSSSVQRACDAHHAVAVEGPQLVARLLQGGSEARLDELPAPEWPPPVQEGRRLPLRCQGACRVAAR
jgi:hypothetical protein